MDGGLGYGTERVLKVRIIAGIAKGRKLHGPSAGWPIRPTLDRIRESLFNILAPRLEGVRFLDCFAGTGANGIEALSRGAAQAVFVDMDARALRLAHENLEHTGLADAAMCFKLALPEALERIPGQYDIIFADPPYEFAQYEALLLGIQQHDLLKPDGLLVVEHHRRHDLPEQCGGLTRRRQNHYGETRLSFFAR